MSVVSMLIKPASSSCNMRCKYCFYADVAKSREIANYGIMSYDTIETIVKKAFENADQAVVFGFQGGEPTIAGLDFFKKTIELQKKYNTKKIQVSNSLQTNGLLITDEFAEFFAKNNFLIGVSLDGTQAIHDKYRTDSEGQGTYERVINATKILSKHRVEYNILTTVNIDVAKNAGKVYYALKKQGFKYLQFIPCLDEFNGIKREYSLTAEAYGEFLIELFKLWYVDLNSKTPISIRYFDNLLMMMGGYPPEECSMNGFCQCYYMIEADGSVYPCDFYVTDEWRLGNVKTDDFASLLTNDTAKKFIKVSCQVSEECKECEYKHICRGGCRRHREPISEGEPRLNELCKAYKMFFDYAMEDLRTLSKKLIGRAIY